MADELIFNEPAPSPIYFGDPTDIGTVKNSDGTYSVNVHSGVTVLPDIDFTDSDGVTSLVPAVKDIVATPHHGADVENSDGSYTAHVNDAATLVVPDSVVTNTDNTYVFPLPATQPHVVPDSNINNSDSSYHVSLPAAQPIVIPDSVVSNSDDTYIVNLPATGALELPDVTHIDSDGASITYPSAKAFTCTPAVYKWYGIEYDITATSPDVTRISSFGDMDLHISLPIQSMMRACLLLDNGTVNYWLDPNDWSKKVDGTASNLDGTDGQVMIYVPLHYRKFETDGNTYRCKISQYPIAGFHAVPAFYIGAYEASLYRPTLKLSSVVNATADYRGGNNNAAWDAQANTLLGKPATQINRTNFRTYARNRAAGTNWNINTYEQHKAITWLFVVEYATRWSQKAVDNTFTAEGYRKGGLGNGVTTANGTEWTNFNSWYPFINCGASNTLATKSGEVSIAVTDFGGVGTPRSFTVNRYRGIEMPFGHIWKNLDGVNVDVRTVATGDFSKMWVTNDPALFNDVNYNGYSDRGNTERANGYVKTIIGGQYGEIAQNIGGTSGGNYNIFWTDHHYQNIATSQLRTLIVGGMSMTGVSAGIVCVGSNVMPTYSDASIGSRLCYIP
jgi:hypothetical protein